MRITTSTDDLKLAVDTVSKAMPQKATLPNMDGIYMKAANSKVLLKCTDMNMQIETVIASDNAEEGHVVMPSLFAEIVHKLPNHETTLSIEGNAATITSGKAKFKIQTLDAENFPKMATVSEEKKQQDVEIESLCKMIRRVAIAAAQDDAKPILRGVLVNRNDGIKMVALDGYRLAITKETGTGAGGEERSIIVPAKALMDIAKIIIGAGGKAKISTSNTHLSVMSSDTRITARLLDGEFIQYEKILPKGRETTIQANRKDLLACIERAALIGREEKSNLVRFEIQRDKISISAKSTRGMAHEDVDAHVVGADLDICFNARYLTDVLKAIDDETIMMEYTTGIAPCVIRPTDGDAYYYLVLPVRQYS